ncbi:MAG: TfoX/Sxy family protein [Planctomycetes bacterium]|nr:TfoX/Sxy family protein [Planctomycetota bacterium]
MAYDENLAARVRALLRRRNGFSEKKMFGGVCFLLNGNMCCGVTPNELMLRLGAEGAADALKEPNTREMDFTGKPMRSMIYVDPEGYDSDPELKSWVTQAAKFASSLPPK